MNGQMPEDEDEQLKLAIALSLQDAGAPFDPLTTPAAANPAAHGDGDTTPRLEPPAESTALTSHPLAPIDPSRSFLGLNRGAMEQERLARLAQSRKTAPPSTQGLKRQRDENGPTPVDTEQRFKRQRSVQDSGSSAGTSNVASPIRWPQGTVKRTWCFGFERTGSDAKIEEVLQKDTLQLAVLSSFIWDVEWILSKIQPSTKLIMVMQAKDEATRREYAAEASQLPGRQIKTCFPPMDGQVNCMHSKLMLLAHPDHLRVVIPTANLVPFDWGETGVMENTVFIIDLPRHEDGHMDAEAKLTFFGRELLHFCRAQGLGEETLRSLGRFDFSATEHMAFVHTIGGEHRSATDRTRTGYPGLGQSVRRLGLQTNAALRIDAVTSSIGALGEDFLQRLYLACKGDDGQIEYAHRTAPKNKSNGVRTSLGDAESSVSIAAIRDAFRLYFPSDDTVRRSRGGPANAGTICFQERWYNAPTFYRKLIRDCRSTRGGVLMHSKILFVQEVAAPPAPGSSESSRKAWAYVGSANCSDSAWGRLVKDRSSKQPKLNCRNWECGVLLPVPSATGTQDGTGEETGLEVFKDRLVVPMSLPAKVLVDHGLQPWFFGGSA